MKQIFLSKNGIEIEEVPDPKPNANQVLVANHYSCISVGTELNTIASVKKSLIKKIINKPKVFKQIYKIFSETGYKNTKQLVRKKLSQLYEIGYSSSGQVLDVGKNVDFIKKGDFAACSGGGFANHAEKIVVPKNLIVKVQKKENLIGSSTVSLGAISLNSIRRANPSIGEYFVVIGLGLIGQITIQILRNCGIEVYAVEPNLKFLNEAKENGFLKVFESFKLLSDAIPDEIKNLGFDGAIITASSESNLILKETFNLCRKKARVILVGDVGLTIDREDIYKKEIDFKISSSYGPGRYDPKYEVEGIDYPLGFVRWTLNRNMSAYIKMLENEQINLKNFTKIKQPIENAKEIYNFLSKKSRPLAAFFSYKTKNFDLKHTVTLKKIKKNIKKINCAIIGGGSFASEILIPNILKLRKFCNLEYICTRTPTSAVNIKKNFNINNISTNYLDVINDSAIDTIFISTRHDLHFEIIENAIKKNKNIFVEKPTCLNKIQLNKIRVLLKNKQHLIFTTGFNRRFSECTSIMKNFIKEQSHPIFIDYEVNADVLERDSWIYSYEGGGRNIGEACHFYDLFLFLIDKKISNIKVSSLNFEKNKFHKTDNFYVVLEFEDSSLARLNYSTIGGKQNKKEIIKIFGTNETLEVTDFKSAVLKKQAHQKSLFQSAIKKKGHEILIYKFFESIKTSNQLMSFDSQYNAMDLAFKIEELI